MRHAMIVGSLVVALASPAAADRDDAFCEVTPCLAGPIKRRTLTRDQKIGRLWCKGGEDAGTHASGKLAFCTLARAQVIDGLPLADEAYTLVHPNGRLYQSHLRKAHRFTLADRSKVWCSDGLIALTPSGALTYCELLADRPIGPGLTARGRGAISFHPDGRIAGASLVDAATIDGLALPALSDARWDAQGALVGGLIAGTVTVQGMTIASSFAKYPGGGLRVVELDGAATVQGHAFPDDAKLELREDGTLAAAVYVEDRGFMIHGEMWTDTAHVTYDQMGAETSHTVEHWQAAAPPPKFRPGAGKRP